MQRYNLIDAETCLKEYWDLDVQPALEDYIRIPCVSSKFDENWKTNKCLDKAACLMVDWVKQQDIRGLTVETHCIKEDYPPLVFVEIKEFDDIEESVLFYGNYDKYESAAVWSEGLNPTEPIVKDDCLYGQGVANNGFSFFSVIAAVKLLQEQK